MLILTLFFSLFSDWKAFQNHFTFEFLILVSPIIKRLVGSLIFVSILGPTSSSFLPIIESAKAWQVRKVIHRNFIDCRQLSTDSDLLNAQATARWPCDAAMNFLSLVACCSQSRCRNGRSILGENCWWRDWWPNYFAAVWSPQFRRSDGRNLQGNWTSLDLRKCNRLFHVPL